MKRLESVVRKVAGAREAVDRRTRAWCAAVRSCLADTRGQGTTEYAILVGVLVVIAIIAIPCSGQSCKSFGTPSPRE